MTKHAEPLTLMLYNTMTKQKEVFSPIDPDNVRMYVCGPTVYDTAHIGNARPVVVFDMLFRLLNHVYGKSHVTYVRNITDVDDKINARAAERGISIRELTDETTAVYHADMDALGALRPTIEPRATEHIDDMLAMIGTLVEKGNAYAAEGHVLFAVDSMDDYGKLSGRSIDDMIAGARVEVAPYKRNPMDFVLWKPSKEGEPSWPSPWGEGRPGWHIECSAMSEKHLGETFDIHGGGIDLAFPHHENEIAQSRCAHGNKTMANIWMHNGFVQVEGEKMSKSLGNFTTVHDLIDQWPGEAIRLALLATHYTKPFNWTADGVREAKKMLDQWYALTADIDASEPDAAVVAALADDLNTPKAFAELHSLRTRAQAGDKKAAASLKASLQQLMGVLAQDPVEWANWRAANAGTVDYAAIQVLIDERLDARNNKDFAKSDELRDQLVALGVVLMDSKDKKTGLFTTEWNMGK
ncbi:cysteine--tRNA ligase [Cohaesibacter celericrescens]|uniref:Cysteine--tRNA ligase n=1 Tax=Cohaesibacter celericrescens TaxID=2067669 RepID=A0A2N5XS84_9HYPH|nr:cysteine--tRNA ligase [Cohaesibacter celericrescens]PLW77373.1 cysteine--tRNA ligase [Cohaesibacter celericrescens]